MDRETQYHLMVNNRGSKEAPEFHWDVLVPEASFGGAGWRNGDEMGLMTEHGVKYKHYQGVVRFPLYPKTQVEVMWVRMRDPAPGEGVWVLWQLKARDGIFPGEGMLASLLLAGRYPSAEQPTSPIGK